MGQHSYSAGTTLTNTASKTELIYITDTLCGWCNVARPTIELLFDAYHKRIPFTLLHRRLFTGNNVPEMDDAFLQKVRYVGWSRAPQIMGRPFTKVYLELLQQEDFEHDSQKTALAVAAAAGFLDRDATTRFAERLMTMVFDEGRDPNQFALFEQVADEFGIDTTAFEKALSADATHQKAVADSRLAEKIQGIIGQGVPALVLRQGSTLTKLIPYDLDQTKSQIEQLLTGAASN